MLNENELKARIKSIIVQSLALEDISPQDIDDSAPLFGDGLGLDSIDALELVIAVKEEFGVSFPATSAESRQHFASVNALAGYISSFSKDG